MFSKIHTNKNRYMYLLNFSLCNNFKILSCAFLLINFTTIFSQVSVDFSVDKTNGCPPLSVTFANLTDDNPQYTYKWEFGNGSTSTHRTPITSYDSIGTYTVSLTVYYENQSYTVTKENYITIHEPPQVDFLPNGTIQACAPVEVSFTSSTNAQNASYTWDFGDGINSNEANPIHTYDDDGKFTVTLIVEDEFGCAATKTYNELITSGNPTAVFEAMPKKSCTGELNTQFNNSSHSIGTLLYTWQFGDGQSSNEPSPQHLYSAEGFYTVSLLVTDELGCKDNLILQDYIEINNTEASFTIPHDTVCPGETILFTNTSVNNLKNNWNFGDGNSTNILNPSHRYTLPGDYTVSLEVENYDCTHTYTKQIHVEEVNGDFTASSNFLCEVPAEITYTGTSNNGVNYDWRFGNGNTSNEQNPTNNYALINNLSENYSDTLIITSKHGCKSKIIKPNFINITLPKLSIITDDKTSGCKPIQLSFSQQTEYNVSNDAIENYTWKLNNDSISAESGWSYDFTEVGKYTVELIAETQLGCLATTSLKVNVGEPIDIDFRVKDKTEFCASEMVNFEILTSDLTKIESKEWLFGDGKKSELSMDFHYFTDTGSMDVTLNVEYKGCLSSITKKNALYINGPIASINQKNICDSPFTSEFDLSFIDSDYFIYDFGDGNTGTSTATELKHTYTEKGFYEVKITAINDNNACNFDTKANVNIANPIALFDTLSSGPCANNAITFDAQKSEDASKFMYKQSNDLYLWDFGDNTPLEFTSEPINHTYKNAGTYETRLIIQDINNCRDTVRKSIEIFKPVANWSSNYQQGCMPITFNFTDLSYTDNPPLQWLWTFGDGETSTLQNPMHEYSEYGKYTVSLHTTDNKGCSSTKTLSNSINIFFPNANFTISDTTSCINDTLEFYDESESIVESFLWSFGDGNTSSLRNPKHAYTTEGLYEISLKIVDNHGCETVNSKTDYISIQSPPSAKFSSDKQESNCYPFPVSFIDESEHSALGNWKWNFGDEQTASGIQNPIHIYTKPGEYDVSLTAFSGNGCSNTITKTALIDVKGPYAEISLVDTACIYNELSFSFKNAKNLSSFFWDFGDGNTSAENSPLYQYNKKGTLYPSLFLYDNTNFFCNKKIRDTVYIDKVTAYFSLPEERGFGCIYDTLILTDTSKFANHTSWLLDNNINSTGKDIQLIYSNDGLYNVSLFASSAFGCSDTITKSITIHPLPTITTSPDTFICLGGYSDLRVDGGIKYEWSEEQEGLDDYFIDQPRATPIITTNYTVTVSDEYNCKNTDTINITVQQPPAINLQDSTIIIGESVYMNTYKPEIKTYSWNPTIELSCNNCPDPIIKPLETKTYFISVTDTSNCFTVEDDITIFVEKKYSVDVPSAFTPNNDGINDIIYIKGWGIKELIYFRIFNRFGEMVFETNNINTGWDGSYKGNIQQSESYNYIVKVKTYNDDFLEKKGSIVIIR
jgi:gliding motility-associated-like protein